MNCTEVGILNLLVSKAPLATQTCLMIHVLSSDFFEEWISNFFQKNEKENYLPQ